MKCPYCKEEIKDGAKKCRFCNEFINKEEVGEEEGKEVEKKACSDAIKKPVWKNWRFRVPILFIIMIIGSIDSDSKTSTTIKTTNITQIQDDSSIPREYKNALKKAEGYANMNFSKQRIYDQLTSEYGEGFSKESAQYAIDTLECDYKENALKMAENYSKQQNMSKNRIYEQLTSQYGEKFTKEEAQYAVDNLTE